MKLKSIIATVAFAAFCVSPAFGQGVGQLGPGQIWGNPTASQGGAQPSSVTSILDRAFGSTRGALIERGPSGWAAVGPGSTAGLPWISNGAGADPGYGVISGAALPTPTASTLGGVQSLTCSTSNWFNTLSTAGAFGCSQPNFTDLAGSIAAGQIPSSAITYAKIQNVTASRLVGNPTGSPAAPSEISLGSTLQFSGSALQTGAMSGDVTSSANSFATTIGANAVTNAKMATMASNTVKGNPTGSSANASDMSMPSCSTAISALTWTTNSGFGCNSISVGGGTNVQTLDYTIQTSDCGKTVQVGTGSTGLKTVTLPAVAGFSEGCAIAIVNGDTSRGKKLSGFPNGNAGCSLGQGILWPAGSCEVQVVNGVWTTKRPQHRWKTPSALTVFSNSGGSNSNDCLATGASNACATAARAIYVACSEFDFTGLDSGQTVLTVQLDTNDTNGIHYSCRAQMGAQGGAPILIQGASAGTILSGSSIDALGVFTNAIVQVRQITLASSTAGSCVTADLHAQVYILDSVNLNACASAHFNATNNSEIYLNNNYAIFGSAPFHFLAQNGGHITTQATVLATLGANITVTDWAIAGQLGGVLVPNWSVNLNSFTVTGTRSAANNLGLIYTGTANCTTSYFPGSVNGGTSGGGQCL